MTDSCLGKSKLSYCAWGSREICNMREGRVPVIGTRGIVFVEVFCQIAREECCVKAAFVQDEAWGRSRLGDVDRMQTCRTFLLDSQDHKPWHPHILSRKNWKTSFSGNSNHKS